VANVDINVNKISEMANDSYEKAKKVASSTSEILAAQSVDALESIGKNALTFLTVQEVTNGGCCVLF
jgi:hypothetical protein